MSDQWAFPMLGRLLPFVETVFNGCVYSLAPRRTEWPADGRSYSERFQRCLSRVRTAAAIDFMRLGLTRDRRKMRQDFSRAIPRSTGARARANARLTVRWVGDSSPPGGRLRPVVTHGPPP